MRVTNGISLGSSFLLPVHTVICAATLKAWGVPKSDFYPALGADVEQLVARKYDAGRGCVNGSAASTCVDMITAWSSVCRFGVPSRTGAAKLRRNTEGSAKSARLDSYYSSVD
jgi:hypothetical protein